MKMSPNLLKAIEDFNESYDYFTNTIGLDFSTIITLNNKAREDERHLAIHDFQSAHAEISDIMDSLGNAIDDNISKDVETIIPTEADE